MKPVFSPDIELAIEAARDAGKAVMEIYQTDFSIEIKRDNSPVTHADLASDTIIKKILTKTGYPINSEENKNDNYDYTQGKVWVVDPLDGTKDFIAKTGEFTILIGLLFNNEPVGGVIYQPVTDTLWVAEKNQGAYQFHHDVWKKIEIPNMVTLANARLVMSKHHLSELEKNTIETLKLSYTQKGSCGYKIAQVASGNFDLYFAFGPKDWDLCAGQIIMTEAGGKLTTVAGNPIMYGALESKIPRGIIAGTVQVWEEFIDFYKKYAKE